MVTLGVLAATLLGPLAGVPGLIWARRLRPFSGSVRIGYSLCWYGCFVAYTATILLDSVRGISFVEVALALACNFAWLAICRKFLRPPARSIVRAVLIALTGTLLAGVVLTPSTATVAVPMPLAIVAYAAMWPVPAFMVTLAFCMPVSFLFPAHLALYWPARGQAGEGMAESDVPDKRWNREYRLIVSYLVGSVFLTWVVGIAETPWNGLFSLRPWFNLFWLLATPIIAIGAAVLDVFNPAAVPSLPERLLHLVWVTASFGLPFLFSQAVMFNRVPAISRFFLEARGAMKRS